MYTWVCVGVVRAHTRFWASVKASLSDFDQAPSPKTVFSCVKCKVYGRDSNKQPQTVSSTNALPFPTLNAPNSQMGPLEGQHFSVSLSPEQDLRGLLTGRGKPEQTL